MTNKKALQELILEAKAEVVEVVEDLSEEDDIMAIKVNIRNARFSCEYEILHFTIIFPPMICVKNFTSLG